jgi:hypothetical protein
MSSGKTGELPQKWQAVGSTLNHPASTRNSHAGGVRCENSLVSQFESPLAILCRLSRRGGNWLKSGQNRPLVAVAKIKTFESGPATPAIKLEGNQLGELGCDVCHRLFCSAQAATRAEQGADFAESFIRRVVHDGNELVTR